MSQIQKTLSPIDGSTYVERPLADLNQVKNIITQADKAQKSWSKISLAERKTICSQAVEAFEANKDNIAQELCWQMGRPIRYAAGEVGSFADRGRYLISIADEVLAPIQTSKKAGFDRYITHEPVGVVLVIAPWNYPLHTPINAVMPALLAGNSVILKHSAQTPLCSERIVEAFTEAGLPEGVLQFLHTSHENTEQAIKSAEIGAVSFTGSVPAGVIVETAAAGRFINVGLELGGKDPTYIRKDADLKHAVESTVDGAFFNSGQSCCGIERIYVDESIYDEYLAAFVALVKEYKLGRSDNPETTLGPLVRTSAAEFVRGQIDEAIEQGAEAHINPYDFDLDEAGTPYMAPQVLTNVDHTMRVMTEESFGPVVGIMKVSSDEEAIKLMNDSEFGLTASIFSSDIERAVTLGQELEAGTFFVNRCDYLDPELVWTGVKNTGRGCTLSKLGFDNFTRAKSFHIRNSI
ncbi:aldehyde dehydrogenase [Colwellia psychrerythraea]|uniref:Aldehyde dehydrogenase n=1 Tax=Colwellia psychrerythraea TaxID=28229 RepID=A0A1Y5EKA8_COLPS|nr:aldehyde dehydrogenase [Colwellia psychrerythraea]